MRKKMIMNWREKVNEKNHKKEKIRMKEDSKERKKE